MPGFHQVLGPVETTPGPPAVLFERDTVPAYVRVVAGAAKLAEDQVAPTVIDPRFPLRSRRALPDTASVTPEPIRPGQIPDAPPIARGGVRLGAGAHARDPGGIGRRHRRTCSWARTGIPTGTPTVDGKPAPVLRGDYTLLSVALPPGAREVRLWFASAPTRGASWSPPSRCSLTLALLAAPLWPAGGARAMPERALVVIPTYNERVNLPLIVPQILQQDPRLEVLVVDDNSPDGTGQLADELAAADPRIHVLHRPGKAGLGKAYLAGFRWALGPGLRPHLRDGRRLLPRSQVPAGLPAGDRATPTWSSARAITPGVNVINWPISRLLLSLGANVYARRITGLPLTDSTGGFKCFRRRGARGHRLRPGPVERLFLPDRDELPGLEEGVPPGGDSDRLHRPGRGPEQDEQADRAGGDLDGLVAPAAGRWRGACERHRLLQDDRVGQRLRHARRPRHRRPTDWTGRTRRRSSATAAPASAPTGWSCSTPETAGARSGWPSGTPTAPGPPCAATRRSAAPGSPVYLELVPRRASSAC